MAAGKNKLLRYCRLIVGGYDLSGDSRTFSQFTNSAPEVDMWGWSNETGNYLAGSRMIGLDGYQAIVNDATGGSFTRLKTVQQTSHLSMLIGGGAAPVAGDLAYLMPSIQIDGTVANTGGTAIIQANFKYNAGEYSNNIQNPAGVVLVPSSSISSTTNGSTVDNGAASSNGCFANLHVLATSSGDFAFTVEHSTDGSSWSTLLTFTVDGSAISSEVQSSSGTVNRYLRGVATRTAGTITWALALARN